MTRIFLLIAVLALAGCQGLTGLPSTSQGVQKAADELIIPTNTMEQRRARALAGAAILSRVAVDRASREPENQARVHSSLLSLQTILNEQVSDVWPHLALRDIRVRIYSAILDGGRQRVEDYISASSLSPLSVLGGLTEAGLDVSTYSAMKKDIACHFAGLPDAPEGVQCSVEDVPDRGIDEVISIYRSMLNRQVQRVEALVNS